MKIVDSRRLTKTVCHDARVTLDNGQIVDLKNCDFGMREYPCAGYELVFDTTNNLAIVSNPKMNGGWDYDPQQGRVFDFSIPA